MPGVSLDAIGTSWWSRHYSACGWTSALVGLQGGRGSGGVQVSTWSQVLNEALGQARVCAKRMKGTFSALRFLGACHFN